MKSLPKAFEGKAFHFFESCVYSGHPAILEYRVDLILEASAAGLAASCHVRYLEWGPPRPYQESLNIPVESFELLGPSRLRLRLERALPCFDAASKVLLLDADALRFEIPRSCP